MPRSEAGPEAKPQAESPPGAAGPEVLAANQRFYDQIAAVYDQADSRRKDPRRPEWLKRVLGELRRLRTETAPPPLRFLDAGAGSGFLSKWALEVFEQVTALDLSRKMLDRIDLPRLEKIQGECASMPFANASFDVVGAFATLHHLHEPKRFFAEAARVLKPGGVLYTDHDIDSTFVRRFKGPLKLHRRFFDHGHRFLALCPEADPKDYELSEFHGERGLDGSRLADQLRELGFQVRTLAFHWEGMGPLAAMISATGLSGVFSRRGFGPVIRLIAVKGDRS